MRLPSHDQLIAQLAPHRSKWGPPPAGLALETPGPGQESVWDYPRPPEMRDVAARVRVEWGGHVIADTSRAVRIVETAGAPVYYLPPDDVATERLAETPDISLCEWKGAALYYDLVDGDQRSRHAAFAYPDPLTDLGMGYERAAGWFGFYAGRVDACWVGDDRAAPQPGGVYAGWVTPDIVGPIKGAPGTGGW